MRRMLAGVAVWLAVAGCGSEQDVRERAEMPDSTPIMRAMGSPTAADSMLDSMPGGEMARGDSTAAMKLLKNKM